MQMSSPAFGAASLIPSRYTCDGENVSPPLEWSDVPDGVRSFALIADDPDAPGGDWVHWVIWNVPAGARSLAENQPKIEKLPDGASQGSNDFRRIGYGGPCPPSGTHRYVFKLHALDAMLELPSGATKSALEKAMRDHLLARVELMGKYRRI